MCRYTSPSGRPAAVIVDVGRQLFVDSFLLDRDETNATIVFHAPRLRRAPVGIKLGGGGLWWDASAKHFKSFFSCSKTHIMGDGALGPLCLSTSADGVRWQTKSQPVWNRSAFSRTILLDEGAAVPVPGC